MAANPAPAGPSLRHGPRKRRRDCFLPFVGAVWLLGLACYAFVWLVDPYALRSPHPRFRLADHVYPEQVVPRLFAVAGGDGTDVVIVGASSARGYTPSMISSAFPEARHPANLAYGCSTADDLRHVLPLLEASKSLKRVIFSLDFTLIWTCLAHTTPLDMRYYTLPWNEPVPEFGAESMEVSARGLLTGVLDRPEWRPSTPDRVWNITDLPPLTQSPDAYATATESLGDMQRAIAGAGDVSCDSVPVIKDLVVPFVRRMSQRGVAVDLLSPPTSVVYYANSHTSHSYADAFAYLMALRRCALEMTAGLPNVRLHFFDADPAITGRLSNYEDIAHICLPSVFEAILRHIALGDHALTPSQWPAAEAQLRNEIVTFKPDPQADGVPTVGAVHHEGSQVQQKPTA
ncbi:MAG TPA: hypothetical protein VHS81_02520 [Caulobacteraceae bacterium]|jgi:hypothetical protein|nr:hypothetical protein [Caulobacteraceae bacterium]